jgi:hypothetical protein
MTYPVKSIQPDISVSVCSYSKAVRRDITPAVPPIVDYSLTPLGQTLLVPMQELKRWTAAYYPNVEKAREEYDLFVMSFSIQRG